MFLVPIHLGLCAFAGWPSVYLDVWWCFWKLVVTKAAAQVQWCCLARELVHHCQHPCSVWRRQQSEYCCLGFYPCAPCFQRSWVSRVSFAAIGMFFLLINQEGWKTLTFGKLLALHSESLLEGRNAGWSWFCGVPTIHILSLYDCRLSLNPCCGSYKERGNRMCLKLKAVPALFLRWHCGRSQWTDCGCVSATWTRAKEECLLWQKGSRTSSDAQWNTPAATSDHCPWFATCLRLDENWFYLNWTWTWETIIQFYEHSITGRLQFVDNQP